MSEEKLEMNTLEVTQAVDLMKHAIGLTDEKKLQFIPWRNFYDGQNDILDKMAELGYLNKWTDNRDGKSFIYFVNIKGFQWLQNFVNVEILLPVARIRDFPSH